MCAFLDPDDIDLGLLSAGREEAGEVLARVLGNQPERIEAIGALAATSLVTVLAEGHLRVHRLVQAVTHDQLGEGQAVEWAKRALNVIAAILPPGPPEDYRSWPAYAKLAPHIEAVTGHATSYPILADKIRVLRNLGIYLSASGQLRAARITCESVLVISEAAYDPGHPEIAMALDELGTIQLRLGELEEARANIESALDGLREARDPNDPEVARALGNLGSVQLRLGEPKDARTSFERVHSEVSAGSGFRLRRGPVARGSRRGRR